MYEHFVRSFEKVKIQVTTSLKETFNHFKEPYYNIFILILIFDKYYYYVVDQ